MMMIMTMITIIIMITSAVHYYYHFHCYTFRYMYYRYIYGGIPIQCVSISLGKCHGEMGLRQNELLETYFLPFSFPSPISILPFSVFQLQPLRKEVALDFWTLYISLTVVVVLVISARIQTSACNFDS